MSGGQQTRAALARLLVAEIDLLMLDEPTNHLDLTAIEWLEQTLSQRPGALLVTSHDRAFLDGVADRIWELRDRRLTVFRGNYSAYAGSARNGTRARARTKARSPSRSRASASSSSAIAAIASSPRCTSTRRALRRCCEVQSAVPERHKTGVLALDGVVRAPAHASGDIAVRVEDLIGGYPGKPVVRAHRLEARRGARIGLVGPNGAGKTTLLRTSLASWRRSMAGWSWVTACRSATSPRFARRRCPARPCSRR